MYILRWSGRTESRFSISTFQMVNSPQFKNKIRREALAKCLGKKCES